MKITIKEVENGWVLTIEKSYQEGYLTGYGHFQKTHISTSENTQVLEGKDPDTLLRELRRHLDQNQTP